VNLLKLLILTAMCGVGGAWLGTVIFFRVLWWDPMPWQAPIPFTFLGSFLLGLAYGYVRIRRPRGVVPYAVVIVFGAIAGDLMLMPFVGPWHAFVGLGYGAITALLWVAAHYLIRNRGVPASANPYGAANG
jgi:peptidoglycan/LPS O-acetylase OafA/YrhL